MVESRLYIQRGMYLYRDKMLVMLFENLSIFWNKEGDWMVRFEIVSYYKKERGFCIKIHKLSL